jgi:hypothetical protein
VRLAGRPASGFFQFFEKSLRKALENFERSQPAGFFQNFADCPNPA